MGATERALDKQYGGHHLVGTENETYQDFHTYNDNPFSTNYDRAWRPLEGHEDFGSYADVHDSKKAYGNEDIADLKTKVNIGMVVIVLPSMDDLTATRIDSLLRTEKKSN